MKQAVCKNLLFITADQFRGDSLSCLGHPFVRTPHLDRVAAEGVLFSQHYSASAPCGPARACMHSGAGNDVHGVWRNGDPLSKAVVNWASELRRNGHDPQLFGFTHTAASSSEGDEWNLQRGFEGILPGLRLQADFRNASGDWSAWLLRRHGLQICAHDLHKAAAPDDHALGNVRWGRTQAPVGGGDVDYLVDTLMTQLQAAPKDPFVVHLSVFAPHNPYLVPYPIRSALDAVLDGSTAACCRPAPYSNHPYLSRIASQVVGDKANDVHKLLDMRRHYWRAVEVVDTALGRLFDFIRQTGEWDNTMLLFTSDHGDQLGDRGQLGKVGGLRETHHIPLLVRDPTPAAQFSCGTRVSRITESLDIAPTLLDFFNCACPAQFQGRSLLSDLRNGAFAAAPQRRYARVYFEFDDGITAGRGSSPASATHRLIGLLDERFTYLEFRNGWPPLLLDEQDTRAGLRDRSGSSGHSHFLREMAGEAAKIRARDGRSGDSRPF